MFDVYLFFFVKQKTAYEMRISDWSSDVCSSDLEFLDSDEFVVLDTTTTPELEAEGLARDVIRAVQDARRSAGLDVSDRIDLRLTFQSATEADAVRSEERRVGKGWVLKC